MPTDSGSSFSPLTSYAQLVAMWSLAVVHPLSGPLRESLLDAAGWSSTEVVGFAFALVLLPPLALLTVEAVIVRVSGRAERWLHTALIAALAGVFVAYEVKRGSPGNGFLILAAFGVTAGLVGIAFGRLEGFRVFVTALAILAVLTIGAFVTDPPAQGVHHEDKPVLGRPPQNGPPVVIQVFDELPTASLMNGHGELDAQRLPNLARFARHATWYRNAMTAADETRQAVPGIDTGRDLRTDANELPAQSLFSLLSPTYRMNVHESPLIPNVCPPSLCSSTPDLSYLKRVRALMPRLRKVWFNQWLPRKVLDKTGLYPDASPESLYSTTQRRALERGITQSSRRPALHFLHSMLPHAPWNLLPSGQRYNAYLPLELVEPAAVRDPTTGLLAITKADKRTRDERIVRQILQAHLAQTGVVDRDVGRLVRRLKATGQYDRSLIVVVADHGDAFIPGQRARLLDHHNEGAILPVPLFVKYPGQRRGRVVERVVRSTDIFPTVAALTRAKLHSRVDGTPLVGPGSQARRPSQANSTVTGKFTYDPERVLRARDRIARSQAELFGAGTPGVELFEFGPFQTLEGKRVSRLPHGMTRANVDLLTPLGSVDPSANRIPAMIAGTLKGGAVGQPVAVALNGRFAGSTWTYSWEGAIRFAALVPPSGLRPGANHAQVFVRR